MVAAQRRTLHASSATHRHNIWELVEPMNQPVERGNDEVQSTIAAASVVVLRPGAVLMVERGRDPFRGTWSFPGGRSEPGEGPDQTARRELLEETGLFVGELVPIGSFCPAPTSPAILLTVFAARSEHGEPVAGDDAVAAAFVPFERVLRLKRTAGAVGWTARALVELGGPHLRDLRPGVALPP